MKPFGLQTVLDYRKRLEDTAQHRLFEARKVYETIQAKLAAEKELYLSLLQTKEQMERKGIEITELIRYEDKIESVQTNIGAIKKNLAEKEKLVDQAQQLLLHRSKERQIMERLKEEQNRAWKNYLDKKEAAMLDEIAIIRHDSDTL